MSHATRKAPPKKSKQTRTWIAAVSVVLIIVTVIATVHFWPTADYKTSVISQANPANASPAFTAFTSRYIEVMKNLNSSETKAKMLALLNPSDNQTQLFSWEGSKMKFTSDPAGAFEDPFQILNDGKASVCNGALSMFQLV